MTTVEERDTTDVVTGSVQEFVLVLNRAPSDDEIDWLYDAGLDDATVERTVDDQAQLHVGRPDRYLMSALYSAIREAESVPDLHVRAVLPEDLVQLQTIADRSQRPLEFLHRAVQGNVSRAEPGFQAFPAPEVGSSDEPDALYSWAAVSRWFDWFDAAPVLYPYDRQIQVADHVVKARSLAPEKEREIWVHLFQL